ncbi:CYTH domain-containing protein [Pistricoccus aurantiacus]|uniref:CYTH domain-containing protein n=1 Tax=Pistricoccus aurantiacus TaxID=1883414 RepID=A0A5B8SNQ2_9GAMM|nr:CYTH domain-containing protein [Pistricoccus aurantiacus]QEA37911.1 CYTH domain-containing protein [Pistricoccus aurantiacus]
MSQEIELKLALSPGAAEQLADHPSLKTLAFSRFSLGNTYYDTPQGHLEKARMALRLRRTEDGWLQTLKTAGRENGGLSQRDEWEWPVVSNRLDLRELAALPPMQGWAPETLAALAPRFSTDFQRTRWLVEQQESSIEVALDRGEIRTGQSRVAICELELELEQGQAAALWALAETFAKQLPLRPAALSKAARGGALLKGRWPLPEETDSPGTLWRRALVALDAEKDSNDPAFRALASRALVRLAGLEHALEDPAPARLARTLAEAMTQPDGNQAISWLDTAAGQAALALSWQLADRD